MNELFMDLPVETNDSNNQWYTPPQVIAAVKTVFGGAIDLDPASSDEANKVVQAKCYYTIKENGLAQPWYGRMFINPPYGKITHNVGALGIWIKKFFAEYEKPDTQIEEAILLTTSDPDERWFTPLYPYLTCFSVPRITFYRPGKKDERQAFGTAFTYVGKHEEQFVEVFGQFGPIYKAVYIPDHLRQHVAPDLWSMEVSA